MLEAFGADGSLLGQAVTGSDIQTEISASDPVRDGAQTLRGNRPGKRSVVVLVVRHVIIFGYGHGLQRAIIDESQHRTPERLIMAQH